MGEENLRKCANCGRLFKAAENGDGFCSNVCRTTALFLSGGGDTFKPQTEYNGKRKKPVQKTSHPRTRRGSDTKFPRVKEMFDLPVNKRWSIAKDFSQDEMDYARRIQKRILNEDKLIDELCIWEIEQPETEGDGRLGESDDGSI